MTRYIHYFDKGITTGISASDRSRTLVQLSNPDANQHDFNRPGHVFPLRAHVDGVIGKHAHSNKEIHLFNNNFILFI